MGSSTASADPYLLCTEKKKGSTFHHPFHSNEIAWLFMEIFFYLPADHVQTNETGHRWCQCIEKFDMLVFINFQLNCNINDSLG